MKKKLKKVTEPEGTKGDSEIDEVRETKKLRSANQIRSALYGNRKEKK